jgi:hypothetical protein
MILIHDRLQISHEDAVSDRGALNILGMAALRGGNVGAHVAATRRWNNRAAGRGTGARDQAALLVDRNPRDGGTSELRQTARGSFLIRLDVG